jgi:ribosomal protein S18 acetylase RimI-like enzyme
MAQADPQPAPATGPPPIPFAPWEIAAIEERRQAEVVRTLGKQSREWAGGIASFDAPGSWINRILNAGSAGEVTTGQVEEIASWYEQRGAEAKITITPYAHPSLRKSLGEAGFVLKTMETLLVADLRRFSAEPRLPEGFSLHTVDKSDLADVDRYAEFAAAIHFGENASQMQVDTLRRAVRHPRSTNHLLRDGHTIVGVCGSERFENLGALWGGAVAPSHRRRGLQRLMIELRLHALRDLGLRWATIASEPTIGTERNALRAGMRPAYTRLEMVRPGEGLVPSP